VSERSTILFGGGAAKKDRFYERNQCFLWLVYRDPHNPPGSLDAQSDTAADRVSITEDVSILRIDHASIKGKLLGVWQALYSDVYDIKEMNRRFVHVFAERT
jgi:hypothetical protein